MKVNTRSIAILTAEEARDFVERVASIAIENKGHHWQLDYEINRLLKDYDLLGEGEPDE